MKSAHSRTWLGVLCINGLLWISWEVGTEFVPIVVSAITAVVGIIYLLASSAGEWDA